MSDFTRSSLLKSVGSSGAFIGGASSIGSAGGNNSSEDFEAEQEPLSFYETYQSLSDALATESVSEMVEFLTNEIHAGLNYRYASGARISLPGMPEHDLVNVPLDYPQDENAVLSLRIFDQTATATATIQGVTYKSNPETVESNIRQTIESNVENPYVLEQDTVGPDYGNYDVITAAEWGTYSRIQKKGTLNSLDCYDKATFDVDSPAPKWVCKVITVAASAATAVGSFVLFIIPEPGTTAIGTVGLTTAATAIGSGCYIGNIINDNTETDISKLTVCWDPNCSWGSYPGVFCEPEMNFYIGDY